MTDKSPSLEVVSDGPTKPMDPHERRRVPRLNLTSEQFRLSRTGKIFSVIDLSVGGMGVRLIDRNDLLLFPIATEVEGTLNLRGDKVPVRARVKHLNNVFVGFEFEGLSPDTESRLKKLLSPELLGADLRPIPAAENGALWYHGSSGTDLLLWRGTDGQYRRLSLFVLGSYAQWEAGTLSTGRIGESPENSEVRGVVRFETLVLEADATPDHGKLNVAKTVILSSNLPQDLKKWCVRQFGA